MFDPEVQCPLCKSNDSARVGNTCNDIVVTPLFTPHYGWVELRVCLDCGVMFIPKQTCVGIKNAHDQRHIQK